MNDIKTKMGDGDDAETGRPGDAEKKVESNQSWVIREQSAGDGRAGGKNRKTRQE